MNNMYKFILISLCFVAPAKAEDFVLPPMLFISTIDDSSFYDKLKAMPLLENIDKENIGNAMRLLVTYKLEPTAGGGAAGFTSALLAGGSLGILPVVTNNDLVITYEIRVHNEQLASVSYRENFTKAQNMYSTEGLYSLDKESLAWVNTTVAKFVEDIKHNVQLIELVDEYNYYFAQAQ
jgi:DNA-directed RNA polymerase alpha subunit